MFVPVHYSDVADGFLERIVKIGYSPKTFPSCSERSVYRIADEKRISDTLFDRIAGDFGLSTAVYLVSGDDLVKEKRKLKDDVAKLRNDIAEIAAYHGLPEKKVLKKLLKKFK